MTFEEAIEYVKQMADYPYTENTSQYEKNAIDAARFSLAALLAQQEAKKNDPLTMDDLRKMDGQPVWAEEPDGYKKYSRWVLVDCAWKSKGLIYLCSWPGAVTFETFSVGGGKVYRRPPVKEEI